MSNVILEAKPIGNIKGNFFVPKYQRGYRWTDSQVKTLMNDLWGNCNQSTKKEYCLQPVVVRKRGEDDYELIDGQQRFTTIMILLNFLNSKVPGLTTQYNLEYETRAGTATFLQSINSDDAEKNTDRSYDPRKRPNHQILLIRFSSSFPQYAWLNEWRVVIQTILASHFPMYLL